METDLSAIELLRADALASRRDEVRSALSSRKRKLQELYAVSRHIERSKPFPNEAVVERWGLLEDTGENLEDAERRFLEENDLEKRLFFNESSLPTYTLPYGGHPPEPGDPAKIVSNRALARTPQPPSQPPASIISPIGFTPSPSTPASPAPLDVKSRPSLKRVISRDNPAQKTAAQPRQTTPAAATPEAHTNGHAPDGESREDVNSGDEDEQLLPSTPTSRAPSPSTDRQGDSAALVVNVLGQPVVQERTTAIPSEQEAAAGVRPPPPPKEFPEDKVADGSQLDGKTKVSTPPNSQPPLLEDRNLEIPDSRESAASVLTPLEKAQLPARPSQLQHLPPHPPLLVSTAHANKPRTRHQRTRSAAEDVSHPMEASSPTSSLDGEDNQSTPGGAILSSATSPDPSHIAMAAESSELGIGSDSVEKVGNAKAPARRKPTSLDELPSKAVAEEVVEQEQEVDIPLPTIPTKRKPDGGSIVEASISGPKSSSLIEPISPDPSAQLQLENQLANGATKVPKNVPLLREGKTVQPPIQAPLDDLDEDDEDEDRVQLVGSNEPTPKILSPPSLADPSATSKECEKEPETPAKAVPSPEPAVEPALQGQASPVIKPAAEEAPIQMPAVDVALEEPEAPTKPAADDSSVPRVPVETEAEDVEMEDADSAAIEQTAEAGGLAEKEGTESGPAAIETAENRTAAEATHTATQVAVPSEPQQSASLQPTEGHDIDVELAGVADANAPAENAQALSSLARQSRKPKEQVLGKIVISSARHAAAAAAAEAKRLREDQEQQGLIVVQRRRNQQAASLAGRGRSTLFQPGSRMDCLTRFGVDDLSMKEEKKLDIFDTLFTVKSLPASAEDLIRRSSKSITTSYHNVHYFDSQAVKILTRIQELQDQGLWSLRQVSKAPEPRRKKVHWDYLLEEMKWLREDFREERKWKVAIAKQVADWVVEWHRATPQQRKEWDLVVDRRRVGRIPKSMRDETARESRRSSNADGDIDMGEASAATPELVAGGESPDDEGGDDYFVKNENVDDAGIDMVAPYEYFKHLDGPPPAALFTLKPEETIFAMAPTKASQDLLDQLPLFAPPRPPTPGSGRIDYVDEPYLRTQIIPASKYLVGQLELERELDTPPRKKSRYEYEINSDLYADDSDEEGEVLGGDGYDRYGRLRSRDKTMKPIPHPPEQNNVALFRPEFKTTLNRVRNHMFRPPTDMPPAPFFEARSPSQWTIEEEDRLRALAKEYNHNWALISTFMTLDGNFHSGAERRSPWECFERWFGIETIPGEFSKTPYYKGVQQRLDLAAKYSTQYANAAANGQQVSQWKRKGTLPMRVERRRHSRQFTLFDAMRKLAKKRETSISKQAQSGRAAQLAAARKQQEAPNSASAPRRTPAYFSLLKYEKEIKDADQKKSMLAQMAQGRLPAGVLPPSPTVHPPASNAVLQMTHPSAAARHAPNGLPLPSAAAARSGVGTPLPGAVRSPHPLPQHGAHLQVPQRGPQPRQYTPAEVAAIRRVQLAQQQQQQQQQQQLPSHQQQPKKVPTHGEMMQLLQLHNPSMSQADANAAASKQLALYHAQLASNMQQRNPGMRVVNGGGPQTGVLIGANGPIGPGSQPQQPQQQQ